MIRWLTIGLLTALVGFPACMEEFEPVVHAPRATPVASGAAADAIAVPQGFSWVDDQLGGMAHPGYGERLERSLDYLANAGADVLVSLTMTPTDPALVTARAMTLVHIPLRDFTAPTPAQLAQFLALMRDASRDGRHIVVHCGAGLGRTGTFLATYFVDQGMTAEAAIAHVRTLRPGSIETDEQVHAIMDFAAL